jgi:hypothetical protein
MLSVPIAIIEEDQAPVTLLSADGTVQVVVTVFGINGPNPPITVYSLDFSKSENSMYIPVIF